jgi:hypothetical protein
VGSWAAIICCSSSSETREQSTGQSESARSTRAQAEQVLQAGCGSYRAASSSSSQHTQAVGLTDLRSVRRRGRKAGGAVEIHKSQVAPRGGSRRSLRVDGAQHASASQSRSRQLAPLQGTAAAARLWQFGGLKRRRQPSCRAAHSRSACDGISACAMPAPSLFAAAALWLSCLTCAIVIACPVAT